MLATNNQLISTSMNAPKLNWCIHLPGNISRNNSRHTTKSPEPMRLPVQPAATSHMPIAASGSTSHCTSSLALGSERKKICVLFCGITIILDCRYLSSTTPISLRPDCPRLTPDISPLFFALDFYTTNSLRTNTGAACSLACKHAPKRLAEAHSCSHAALARIRAPTGFPIARHGR